MLAVALNYIGTVKEKKLGSMLVKLFDDFMVIKSSPSDDLKEGRLQLCQPVVYEDLRKDIQKLWVPSENFLELRGPKVKLLRMVRHMLFFDEKKKFEKVFLEGCDGIADFPWACQIVMIQLPVLGWEQAPEWIRKADIIVLNDSAREENRAFIAKVIKNRPDISVFTEKVQEGLSEELKDSLEALFADYVEKRERIKDVLELQYSERLISCAQARGMAKKLGVSPFLCGNVCDECGYRITNCGLSCF